MIEHQIDFLMSLTDPQLTLVLLWMAIDVGLFAYLIWLIVSDYLRERSWPRRYEAHLDKIMDRLRVKND